MSARIPVLSVAGAWETLERISASIAEINTAHDDGRMTPTSRAKLAELRDQREIVERALDRAQAREDAERADAAEAERQAAAARREAAIAALLDRLTAANAAFCDKTEALRDAVAECEAAALAFTQASEQDDALFRLPPGAAGYFLQQHGADLGRLIASTLSRYVDMPTERPRAWPHDATGWPERQRDLLQSKIEGAR